MKRPFGLEGRREDSVTAAGPREKYVRAGDVRLHYLDWGGTGPLLLLIHGLADNPYIFCDLAPAFTDRFHVVAYARRGAGRSDAIGPFDTATFTDDLCNFLNVLGVDHANLVGWSLGGNETTAMAARYPERVDRIVYLDGAYDWADPQFVVAFKALPSGFLNYPRGAMESMEAYVAYKRAVEYTRVGDMRRVAAYLHESVVRQPDGAVEPRMAAEIMDAMIVSLLSDRRDYTRVHCPALAFYADYFLNLFTANVELGREARVWEERYMVPFRAQSIQRVQRELPNVEVIRLCGTHEDFFFTCRDELIASMRRFLTVRHPDNG